MISLMDKQEIIISHFLEGKSQWEIHRQTGFERWDEIFKDPVMTAAMIDRMTHKSYIVNMNGTSYRLKETKQWLQ